MSVRTALRLRPAMLSAAARRAAGTGVHRGHPQALSLLGIQRTWAPNGSVSSTDFSSSGSSPSGVFSSPLRPFHSDADSQPDGRQAGSNGNAIPQRRPLHPHNGNAANSPIDFAADWHYLPGTPEDWKKNASQPLWALQEGHEKSPKPLPLPEIDVTLRKFEEYVRPLISQSQLERVRDHIRTFVNSEEAVTIQEKLSEIARESGTGSYIEGFWNSMYLDIRESQVINTTPFLLLGLDFVPTAEDHSQCRGKRNQLERAAAVAWKCADFEARIRTGKLEPDQDKSGAMDSTQYTRFFSAARIPDVGRDFMRYARPHRSRHIAVIRNNHVFAVDVLEQAAGDPMGVTPLPEERIFASLQSVMRMSSYKEKQGVVQGDNTAVEGAAGEHEPRRTRRTRHQRYDSETGEVRFHPNMGSLTSMDRDSWAKARKHLLDSERRVQGVSANRRSLSVIESALCVLCLDTHDPKSLQDTSRHLIAASNNRWWDKTQFVVLPSGRVALLLEHTAVDGHTGIRLCAEIKEHLETTPSPPLVAKVAKFNELKRNGQDPQEDDLEPSVFVQRTYTRELDFQVDDQTQHSINSALASLEEAAVGLDTFVVDFSEYGSTDIKKAGFSPDAFIQMAFQLAYYRTYEKFDSTYESANTKGFLAGRTETLRVVTNDSVKFCKRFSSSNSPEENLELLRLACGAHVARMKDAKSGLGVDRHMYAMNKVAKLLRDQRIDFHIPQIFNDMAYSKLMTSVLSTSNVSHPCFHLFGFGPVCADGLGIAYNVHGDRMFVNVTSFKEQARPYAMELTKTLKEMMQVVREAQNAK